LPAEPWGRFLAGGSGRLSLPRPPIGKSEA
jgi:hypothetical protein